MEPTRQPLFARKNVVYLSAAFCCLLWGNAYPAIRSGYEIFQIATDNIPLKIVFAGYRFPFAGLLLLLLAATQRKPIGRLSPRQYDQLTLLGLAQTLLQHISLYIDLALMMGVKESIMNTTGIFFSMLLVRFTYYSDKPSYNKALGCTLGSAGVMVVNFSSGMDFSFNLLGSGSVVMAAFILFTATLHGKRIPQTVDPVVMIGYQLGGGGLVLAVDGYVFGGMLTVHSVSSAAILGHLTLLSSVALALWSILLRHNRVGMIAPFNFLILVSGAVLSAIFLGGNILEWKYAVALVLVCLEIWWVNKVKRRRFTLMPDSAIAYQA